MVDNVTRRLGLVEVGLKVGFFFEIRVQPGVSLVRRESVINLLKKMRAK